MSTVENWLENERKFIEINKNISVYKIKMNEFMTPASQPAFDLCPASQRLLNLQLRAFTRFAFPRMVSDGDGAAVPLMNGHLRDLVVPYVLLAEVLVHLAADDRSDELRHYFRCTILWREENV